MTEADTGLWGPGLESAEHTDVATCSGHLLHAQAEAKERCEIPEDLCVECEGPGWCGGKCSQAVLNVGRMRVGDIESEEPGVGAESGNEAVVLVLLILAELRWLVLLS